MIDRKDLVLVGQLALLLLFAAAVLGVAVRIFLLAAFAGGG